MLVAVEDTCFSCLTAILDGPPRAAALVLWAVIDRRYVTDSNLAPKQPYESIASLSLEETTSATGQSAIRNRCVPP